MHHHRDMVSNFDHEDKATFTEKVESERYKQMIADLYRFVEPNCCKRTLAISAINFGLEVLHDLSRDEHDSEYLKTGRDARGGDGKRYSGSY